MNRSGKILLACLVLATASCGGKHPSVPNVPAYGTSWRKVADVAAFRRYSFGSAVFGGKLWVLGGWHIGGGIQSDCFSSADGVTWSTRANSGLGNASMEFPVFVHDAGTGEELWAASGGQVLRSTDGQQWTMAADVSTTMGYRRGQLGVSFDPDGAGGNPASMFLIAGSDGSSAYYSDVWGSTTGTTWTMLPQSAPFTPRWGGAAVVFENRIWIIGGAAHGYSPDSYKNDVWSSPNGSDWTLMTANAGFSPRMFHSAVVFGGRIWVIGGRGTRDGLTVTFEHDVWNSADGVLWTRVTDAPPFAPRMGHACLVHDAGSGPRIWLIGGYDGATDSLGAEVWRAE
jgi:hypothetical protein